MSSERENMATFREMLSAWQLGDVLKADSLVSPDYIGHVSSGDRNIDGLKERISAFKSMYRDAVFQIEDQFAVGEKVVTRMTAHATDAATGKPIRMMGINISRFSNARMCEEWATWEVVRA